MSWRSRPDQLCNRNDFVTVPFARIGGGCKPSVRELIFDSSNKGSRNGRGREERMSALVDIAIGLILTFLAVSLVVTAMQEGIESVVGVRASQLQRGIANMFGAPASAPTATPAPATTLLDEFNKHPLISSLSLGNARPSYIPAQSFAQALVAMMAKTAQVGATASVTAGNVLAEVQAWVKANPGVRIADAVGAILLDANGDLDKLKAGLEKWFDTAMERVSGVYKRLSQWIGFGLGFMVAILMNVDTIGILNTLSTQESVRNALASLGASVGGGKDMPQYQELVGKIKDSGLPLGWNPAEWDALHHDGHLVFSLVGLKILGFVFTGFAASLGASFWFDTLQRFVRVRAAGEKPQQSKKS
jgi:hypothetical protein